MLWCLPHPSSSRFLPGLQMRSCCLLVQHPCPAHVPVTFSDADQTGHFGAVLVFRTCVNSMSQSSELPAVAMYGLLRCNIALLLPLASGMCQLPEFDNIRTAAGAASQRKGSNLKATCMQTASGQHSISIERDSISPFSQQWPIGQKLSNGQMRSWHNFTNV